MNNPITDEFGNKYWYNKKELYHREDGPAVEGADGYKAYYINGLLHREDGPALEYSFGCKEYWINGVKYSSLEQGLMDQALK